MLQENPRILHTDSSYVGLRVGGDGTERMKEHIMIRTLTKAALAAAALTGGLTFGIAGVAGAAGPRRDHDPHGELHEGRGPGAQNPGPGGQGGGMGAQGARPASDGSVGWSPQGGGPHRAPDHPGREARSQGRKGAGSDCRCVREWSDVIFDPGQLRLIGAGSVRDFGQPGRSTSSSATRRLKPSRSSVLAMPLVAAWARST